MNKKNIPLTKYFQIGVISVVYAIIVAIYVARISPMGPIFGDETAYLNQSNYLLDHGIVASMLRGDSVLYVSLMVSLSKLGLSLLLAGRIITLIGYGLLMLGIIHLSKRILRLSGYWLHFVLISALVATLANPWYFRAMSDGFLATAVVWTLILGWKASHAKRGSYWALAAGVGLAICTTIRPLALIFIPGIILAYLLFTKSDTNTFNRNKKIRIVAAGCFGFIFAFSLYQAPSLVTNGKIALEDKNPNQIEIPANWVQRTALVRIRYDEGSLKCGLLTGRGMVNWQQTLKYLQEHGKDSLPRDMIHYILWKPRAWIKNFIYNTCVALPVGMVYIIGIVCFAPLLVLPFHQRSIPRRILFFTLIAYMYTVFLNTALILFVEWRWYIVPSLLLIACGVASLRYALRSRFIYMLELKLVSSGTVIKKACKFFGYGLPRLFLTLQLIYLLFTFYRLFK